MTSSSCQDYPWNLPTAHTDQWLYDLNFTSQRLKEDASILFAGSDEETYLQVTEYGQEPRVLEGPLALTSYLLTIPPNGSCRRMWVRKSTQLGAVLMNSSILPRLSSIDPLLISERCMRQLLSHLRAFPPLVDVLHAFCTKGDNVFGGPSIVEHVQSETGAKELCFLMRYVERHGRGNQLNPWSQRLTGIYYRGDVVNQRDTFLLIHPSMRLQQRLKGIAADQSGASRTLCVIIDSSNRNWTEYIDYHESRLCIVNKKINSSVNFDVDFSDMVVIHNIHHHLCTARTAINQNRRVMSKLESEHALLLSSSELNLQCHTVNGIARINNIQLEELISRIDSLLVRLDSATSLIASILELHANRALEVNNQRASKMAEIGQYGNDLMLRMTRKSVQDARTLKTITILTLVYLPASFVSTFLGMNYVKIEGTNPVVLSCKAEMVIFAILTLLLLLVTLGAWGISEYRHKGVDNRNIVRGWDLLTLERFR